MSSARGEPPSSGLHRGCMGGVMFVVVARCCAACDSHRPAYSPKYFFSPLFVVFR